MTAASGKGPTRIRLGFVGGGRGALIGPVHRTAARLDDRFEVVGAVLSSNAEKSVADAAALGIPKGYGSLGQMIRAGGLDAVAIATPNDSHAALAIEALDAGLHVVCDKPLANTAPDGRRIAEKVAETGLVFCLTHNYSGYPMIRQMRAMIEAGRIGKVHLVQASYRQGTLATAIETGDIPARLRWRLDPAKGGGSHVMGDIGSHVHQLIRYTTGLGIDSVMAELGAIVPGRQAHDTGQALLRFANGGRGQMLATKVAHGAENALAIEVHGDRGGLEWRQSRLDELTFLRNGEPQQILTRGSPYLEPLARQACRLPPGHPEGFHEGFGNLYRDFAEQVAARLEGREADPLAATIPTAADGLDTLLFIDACIRSSETESWQRVET
ncbi:MAG: Gfo/Idh/MocA family oxidoreductase [Geminicoccaceae bacterium]|nr:Gfo/Idh/MocA family oxidoreductase [Geminicoccaceae bacterium]